MNLRNLIECEFNDCSKYVTSDLLDAKKQTLDLCLKFDTLPYIDSSVELTERNSAKFKLIFESNVLIIIDKVFDETIYQIDSFEEGCGVALLQEYNSDAIPETILVHQEYDHVCEFVETDAEYTFCIRGHEYNVPKIGLPIFYKFFTNM